MERSERQHAAPPSPREEASLSLRAIAIAALGERALAAEAPDNEPPELRTLREHRDLVHMPVGGWHAALRRYLKTPDERDQPLLFLGAEMGLNRIEMLSIALAAAVEDDLMLGRAIARLQAPVGGSRPTVGLIISAFADAAPKGTRAIDALLTGAAVSSGLINLLGDGAPMPERAISVAQHICHALAGQDGVLAGTTIGVGDVPHVPLPASIFAEAERHARGLIAAPNHVLVIRSGSTAESHAVAAAVAAAMHKRPLFIQTEKTPALAPWLLLRRLLPIYTADLSPGERKVMPPITPAVVACGPDGSIESPNGSAVSWTIPVAPRHEREALWANALTGGSEALAHALARDYRHATGRIAQLGRLVHQIVASDERDEPTMRDVATAAWAAEGSGLEALAQPLPERIQDDALVLTAAVRRELATLLSRCRARDGLVTGLGASSVTRYHPGVRALFVGPSGTGKTLAAGWLATRLGLPLYRVDLASITSKYIGETEKNLAHLLARAEHAEVVLLFDEADSLFGKRTDVKDSNDRFANAQTNYLLQRIESYDGITLLTSNSRTRFDSAFSRRLDVIVEFPLPGPEERRALWLSHLGDAHTLEAREINQLGARVDLAGGHIRNAVLTAAVLAHDAGRAIGYADVTQGLASEYRKLGKQLPVDLHRRE